MTPTPSMARSPLSAAGTSCARECRRPACGRPRSTSRRVCGSCDRSRCGDLVHWVQTSLGVVTEQGCVEVEGTRSVSEPRLWLVGYGSLTRLNELTQVARSKFAQQSLKPLCRPGRYLRSLPLDRLQERSWPKWRVTFRLRAAVSLILRRLA